MTRMRRSVLALVVSAGVHLGSPGRAAAEEETQPSHDCGTVALFVLLRLEGRPVTFEGVADRLPPATPRGYSMAELRDAARGLGARLSGVKLHTEAGRAPERPAIAYLRRGDVGHFVAIRPVGHTGTLVQVLDEGHDPEVLDAAALYASREWTGLALVPSRAPWLAWAIAGAGLAAVGLGIGRAFRRGRGRLASALADSTGRTA